MNGERAAKVSSGHSNYIPDEAAARGSFFKDAFGSAIEAVSLSHVLRSSLERANVFLKK